MSAGGGERHAAALELGGTHVSAALVTVRSGRSGTPTPARPADIGVDADVDADVEVEVDEVEVMVRRPLDAHGSARTILSGVIDCARALMEHTARASARAPARSGLPWGVAVPGPFDYARGIALFSGVGKFDALHGVDVRRALLDGLRGHVAELVFLNDAHAFLEGEWRAGAARGHRRCVGLTLGTGVGSAFFVDGRVRRSGAGVPPDGRIDRVVLDGRPLEHSVSRRAILARYADAKADADGEVDADADVAVGTGMAVDVRDICARAAAGEDRAQDVLNTTVTALGGALAPFLTAFGASLLVVGGSIAGSWDVVGPPLRAGLARTPVTVLPGALAADAPLIGAAAHAVARHAG